MTSCEGFCGEDAYGWDVRLDPLTSHSILRFCQMIHSFIHSFQKYLLSTDCSRKWGDNGEQKYARSLSLWSLKWRPVVSKVGCEHIWREKENRTIIHSLRSLILLLTSIFYNMIYSVYNIISKVIKCMSLRIKGIYVKSLFMVRVCDQTYLATSHKECQVIMWVSAKLQPC